MKICIGGLLLCSILLCHCRKTEDPFENLSGGRIYIIGHGGSGFNDQTGLPPNSWPSLTRAVESLQADGVEIDVRMSGDSVLFMYHDESLEAASFCSGCIKDYTAKDLAACRFRGLQGAGERESLATVEALIERFAARKIKPLIFLDLKNPLYCAGTQAEKASYYRGLLHNVYLLLKKHDAFNWIMLQSSKRRWLSYAKAQYPEMLLLYDYIKDSSDIEFAAAAGLFGVAAPSGDLTKEEIALAHTRGLTVQLYGAKSQQDIVMALNKAPDYFLADNIPLTQRILE